MLSSRRTHIQAGLMVKCGKDWMQTRLRVVVSGGLPA